MTFLLEYANIGVISGKEGIKTAASHSREAFLCSIFMKNTKTTTKAKVNKPKTAKLSVGAVYMATIKVLGKIYTAEGNSVTEALMNLKPSGSSKGVSILTMARGEMKKDKVLVPAQTFRLFSQSKLMREIALKQTSMLFGDL